MIKMMIMIMMMFMMMMMMMDDDDKSDDNDDDERSTLEDLSRTKMVRIRGLITAQMVHIRRLKLNKL